MKKTLKESLNAPEFVMTDFAKFGRPEQCNMAMIALHAYKKKHGSLPKPWCKVCSQCACLPSLYSNSKNLNTPVVMNVF